MIIDILIYGNLFIMAMTGLWLCSVLRARREISKRLPDVLESLLFPPVLWFKAMRLFLNMKLRWCAPDDRGLSLLLAIFQFYVFTALGAAVDVQMHFSPGATVLLCSYWFLLPMFQLLAILIAARKNVEK